MRALLLIDFQREFFDDGFFKAPMNRWQILPYVHTAIAAFTDRGWPVVAIRSEYSGERLEPKRPPAADPSLEPVQNDDFHASGHSGKRGCCPPGSEKAELIPELELPSSVDHRIKTRFSSFVDTDLDGWLRGRGVDEVVVAGVAMNVCVQATSIDARRLGYRVSVIEEAVLASSDKLFSLGVAAVREVGVEVESLLELLPKWGCPPVVSGFGAGDISLYGQFLPDSDRLFTESNKTVPFDRFEHKGGEIPREVAVVGVFTETKYPIYRHPVDLYPKTEEFTGVMEEVRVLVSERVGQKLNHALIQRYRPESAISPHADKTLDMVDGVPIYNYSLGAERTLTIRLKDHSGDRRVQRIRLPHNSLLRFGLESNRRYTHEIKADKRPEKVRSDREKRFGATRISYTLRMIGSFWDGERIVGQGSTTRSDETEEAEELAMLKMFSDQNRNPEFAGYDRGFSVRDLRHLNRVEGRKD